MASADARPGIKHPARVFATPAEPGPPAGALALEGGGLRIFTAHTGAARALPFDTAKTDVLRIVATVLGTGPVEEGENRRCFARPLRWLVWRQVRSSWCSTTADA